MQSEINKAIEILKNGGVILYPTDTVWGLGCDASDASAIKKIFEIKKRPDHKAMIVLISEIGQLYDYVQKIPEIAWDLVDFAEEPLTVIYPQGKNVAPELLGEDGSIAVRLVRDEFCRKLISKFRKAIVSTSANLSGDPAPAGFAQINSAILSHVDYVVNWRQQKVSGSKPSTIIKLELNGEIKFIRK
ncbi:MAG TPA: L-threonylcarbamoyladenylate synthase [Cytophagaceae bacterium]|jgi:L-threonylcarbamoyladenylate synthase|nr:L-threonylcarbamoyladenylate synthase [Cytophagaceae bacterium]